MTLLLLADADSIHTRRIVNGLRARGHRVHLASFARRSANDTTMHALPTFKLGKAGYFLAIPSVKRLVRSINPDVVHAHYATSYGVLAATVVGQPVIISAWGSDVLIGPRESCMRKLALKFALPRADAVTAEAEHVRAAAVNLGASTASTEVIPFGVDLKCFRRRWEAKGVTPLRLISTRNLYSIYDVGTFIEALRVFSKSFIEFAAVIAGDGPCRRKLERLVASYELTEKVVFVGRLCQERLGAELAASHIFVTTSLSDGESISLEEAMACGCFPVASAIPATMGVVSNGKNGLLFEAGNAQSLADALRKAIALRARWPDIAVANRAWVEEFADSEAWFSRMEAIYIQVLEARREKIRA